MERIFQPDAIAVRACIMSTEPEMFAEWLRTKTNMTVEKEGEHFRLHYGPLNFPIVPTKCLNEYAGNLEILEQDLHGLFKEIFPKGSLDKTHPHRSHLYPVYYGTDPKKPKKLIAYIYLSREAEPS